MQLKNPVNERLHGADDNDENDIDLRKYLVVLWRYRFVIGAITALCGAVVLVTHLRMATTYEASTQLLASASKMGAANEMAQAVSVSTFRTLALNQSTADKIVAEFGLGQSPHSLTPLVFLDSCVSVDTVPDTNVIEIKVRLWNADLASRVANRMANATVDLSGRLNQEDTTTARDITRTQMDQSRDRFERAEAQLQDFRKKCQIDLLRKDVDALLNQRAGLASLLVDIEVEKARLREAEGLFAKRDRVETLKRSIDTEPAAMEAARKAGAENVLSLQMRNEYFNPVYQNLDGTIAESQTKLAGLERQKTELIDVRKLDKDQHAKLTLLYERERELDQRQAEVDLAKAAYVAVATRYEQTRLQVAGRSAQLQVLDPALPPDRPVSRHTVRDTGVALLAAWMVAIFGVLLFDWVLRARSERPVVPKPPDEPGLVS